MMLGNSRLDRYRLKVSNSGNAPPSGRPGNFVSPPTWRPSRLARILRKRFIHWLLFGVLGLILLIWSLNTGRASEQYGHLQKVAVAVEAIETGDRVESSIEWRSVPEQFIPDSAVYSLDAGAVARKEIYPGEVLTAERVADSIFHNKVAVGVPSDSALLSLKAGDRVSLISTYLEPQLTSAPVAENAVVLEVSEDSVTVLISQSEAAPAISALNHGEITIVRIG